MALCLRTISTTLRRNGILRALKKAGTGFAVAAFWIIVWQLIAMAVGSSVLFVGPVSAAQRLIELLAEGAFYSSIVQTLINIVVGFALAMVLGIFVAFCTYFDPVLKALIHPLVRFMRVVPVASLTIVILVFMSSRQLPSVVSFLMVFPLVYLNVFEGIDRTDAGLREMSAVFRVPFLRQVRQLYLPSVRPYIYAAYETGFGYAWKSAVTAEVISSATNSIGSHLSDAKVYLDMPSLLAWTVVIVVLATVTEKVALALFPRGGSALAKAPATDGVEAPEAGKPGNSKNVTSAGPGGSAPEEPSGSIPEGGESA